jgi:RsiW-degrading membrane proteinase PrsW (M82 family)
MKPVLDFPGRDATINLFDNTESGMAIVATLFFGFAPMFLFAYILYWLDHYEKEPVLLLGGVFLWGMVVAAGGAYILNTAFGISIYYLTGSEAASDFAAGTFSAPLFEEGLKGLAVLLVFLVFYNEFDSILDGIVYAGITALGFAATENSIYIWRGFASGGWEGLFQLVFIRVIIVGWQHPFFTSFTGIGLAVARMNRSTPVKVFAPLLGWSTAMFAHSIHNTLASFSGLVCLFGTLLDWTGILFMLGVIAWANWMEQRNIINQLSEEVQLGIISKAQYQTACSAWAQTFARLTGLLSGRFTATSRFYQTCGKLAHKKQQLSKLGEERGNSVLIQLYRAELARLAVQAQS